MGIFDRNTDQATQRERLETLCRMVDLTFQQFRKAGEALREIRDEKLYRLTHLTFADFCRDRWNISDRHATRLINAANVCDLLGEAGDLIETENQARQVAKLDSDQLVEFSTEIRNRGSDVAEALKKHLPTGKKSQARLKPFRFRLPGGTVIIEPNKRFTTVEDIIGHLLTKLEQSKAA